MRSQKTKLSLTEVVLKTTNLSDCLSIMDLWTECPNIKTIDLTYCTADIDNDEEAVHSAIKKFVKKYGIIECLKIRDNKT